MRTPSNYLAGLLRDYHVAPKFRGHVLSVIDRPEHVDQEVDVIQILQTTTPEWFTQKENQ